MKRLFYKKSPLYPIMGVPLELKEGEKCLGLFYMGYPAIDWPKGQRKPIEYVTKWK